jgi:acyl carrier protein
MSAKLDVTGAIYGAIDDINRQLPAAKRLTKEPAAAINAADLDSLNMVNFLLAVEERLQLDCNLEIDLGEAIASSAEVPFTNVAELTDYIHKNSKSSDPL